MPSVKERLNRTYKIKLRLQTMQQLCGFPKRLDFVNIYHKHGKRREEDNIRPEHVPDAFHLFYFPEFQFH